MKTASLPRNAPAAPLRHVRQHHADVLGELLLGRGRAGAEYVWQAEVNKMKVAQLDELLRKKGVTPRGVKAERAMDVAWSYTRVEIADWRAQQEELTPPALLSTPRPSQPTMDNYFSAKRARCTHDFVRGFPSGPRDNGECRDVCRLCKPSGERATQTVLA